MTDSEGRKRVSGSVRARTRAVDRPRAEAAVRDLLAGLGFDPEDPALATSPARVVEAFVDVLTTGYSQSPEAALGAGFPVEADNPVIARAIPLQFVCPHHLMPARGLAHVGFVPRGRVPGLSRLTRLVDAVSRRLVLQEDIAAGIVEALAAALDVEAAVAVVEARHTCVAVEDFARADTTFVTRAERGPAARIASLDALLFGTVSAPWSTSASEPPAAPPGSKSPSR